MIAEDLRRLIKQHGSRSDNGVFLANADIGPLSEAIMEALYHQRETDAYVPVEKLKASSDR